jgi:hypothetical protein
MGEEGGERGGKRRGRERRDRGEKARILKISRVWKFTQ